MPLGKWIQRVLKKKFSVKHNAYSLVWGKYQSM